MRRTTFTKKVIPILALTLASSAAQGMIMISFASDKTRRKSLAFALATLLMSGVVPAAAPQCYTYPGGAYCQYDGKVNRAYVNAYGQILMYFDTLMDLNAPAQVGITGVQYRDAGLYPVPQNPDFAKSLYATLLAAQARGATVSVQFHGSHDGYLKIDRIWINEN